MHLTKTTSVIRGSSKPRVASITARVNQWGIFLVCSLRDWTPSLFTQKQFTNPRKLSFHHKNFLLRRFVVTCINDQPVEQRLHEEAMCRQELFAFQPRASLLVL